MDDGDSPPGDGPPHDGGGPDAERSSDDPDAGQPTGTQDAERPARVDAPSSATADDPEPLADGPGPGSDPAPEPTPDEPWGPPADQRSPLGWLRWALTVDEGVVAYVRELLVSVFAVLMVGVLLFAVSGVWPPMVAIESGSMEPHIQTGDLVFVMEEHRFPGPNPTVADGESTGVVTYRTVQRTADEYTKFGVAGDVIVYQPNGREGTTPIIHRARFWVNESENWYDKADPDYVGTASDCDELRNCPAPNAGFITKGDNERTNRRYDQLTGISRPVDPSWVVGTAEFRIPLLGYVRLGISTLGDPLGGSPLAVGSSPGPGSPVVGATAPGGPGGSGTGTGAGPNPVIPALVGVAGQAVLARTGR
jgi:signal peptidase